MRRNFIWKWEKLDDITWRAKVIGGWIIAHGIPAVILDDFKKGKISPSMVFIPDSDHLWNIISEAKETAVHTPKIKASDFETPKP